MFEGFAVGEFMRGVGGVVSGYTRLGHDIYSNINNLFYDETDEEYITDQEKELQAELRDDSRYARYE